MNRILVHFSCGAASAVAWKVTEERYGKEYEVEAVYANMLRNEHEDNDPPEDIECGPFCQRDYGEAVHNAVGKLHSTRTTPLSVIRMRGA